MKCGKTVAVLFLAAALVWLTGCGGTAGTEEGAYQRVNLSMAVNGTDTQIDSLVANYFAELVAERSEGNIVIDDVNQGLNKSVARAAAIRPKT